MPQSALNPTLSRCTSWDGTVGVFFTLGLGVTVITGPSLRAQVIFSQAKKQGQALLGNSSALVDSGLADAAGVGAGFNWKKK